MRGGGESRPPCNEFPFIRMTNGELLWLITTYLSLSGTPYREFSFLRSGATFRKFCIQRGFERGVKVHAVYPFSVLLFFEKGVLHVRAAAGGKRKVRTSSWKFRYSMMSTILQQPEKYWCRLFYDVSL